MIAAGVVFCVLGTLLFFVSERVTVQVGLLPFSFLLIFVLVAGVIMFGCGLLMFIIDRYWNVTNSEGEVDGQRNPTTLPTSSLHRL